MEVFIQSLQTSLKCQGELYESLYSIPLQSSFNKKGKKILKYYGTKKIITKIKFSIKISMFHPAYKLL